MLNVWFLVNNANDPPTAYLDPRIRHSADVNPPIQVPYPQNSPYIHPQMPHPNIPLPMEALHRPRHASQASFEFLPVTRELPIAYHAPHNMSALPQHMPYPLSMPMAPIPNGHFTPDHRNYSVKYLADAHSSDVLQNDALSLRRSPSVTSSQSPKSIQPSETPAKTRPVSTDTSSELAERLKLDVLSRFEKEIVKDPEPGFIINEIGEDYLLYIDYCIGRGFVTYDVSENLVKDYVRDRILVHKLCMTKIRAIYAAFRRSIKRAYTLIKAAHNDTSKFDILPLLNSNYDFRIWYQEFTGHPFDGNDVTNNEVQQPPKLEKKVRKSKKKPFRGKKVPSRNKSVEETPEWSPEATVEPPTSARIMRSAEKKTFKEEIVHLIKERVVLRSCISSTDRRTLSGPEISLLEKFDEIDFTSKFPTGYHQIAHIKAYICCCARNKATTFMMNNDILKLYYEEIIQKANGNVTEDEILEINESIDHFSKLKMSSLQDTPNTNLLALLVSKYQRDISPKEEIKIEENDLTSIQQDILAISRKNKDAMKTVTERIQQLNGKFSRELDDVIGVLSSTSTKRRKVAPVAPLEGTRIKDVPKRYRNMVFIEPDTLGYLNDTITLEDLVLKYKDLHKIGLDHISAESVDRLVQLLNHFVDPVVNIFRIAELCDDYRRLKVLNVPEFLQKLDTSPDRLMTKLAKYIRRRKEKYMF